MNFTINFNEWVTYHYVYVIIVLLFFFLQKEEIGFQRVLGINALIEISEVLSAHIIVLS